MYTVEGFCQAMAFNEALFGQTEADLYQLMREIGVDLNFEFQDIYLCLTGLPRGKYRGRIGMSRPRYQQILHPRVEELLGWAKENGLTARYAVVHYNGSKQVCFFLREGEDGLRARSFAEEAVRRFEEKYQDIEQYKKAGLANFTLLSPLISTYDHVAESFLELQRLERFSFFRMEPSVFTAEMLQVRPMEQRELYERTEQIEQLLQTGGLDELERAVHRLFSERLKGSLDFEGCGTAVYELNRIVYKLCELLPPGENYEPWKRLSVEHFVSIEELERAVIDGLRCLRKRLALVGNHRWNPLTLKAAKWLMEHYTQNVGLQETAAYLGVSPAYLSRTFSRDMGMPLSAYLRRLRLEQAEKLLVKSDIKITQVAEQSGFHDSEYFGVLFRKKTGLYPQKYREMYKKERLDNRETGQ